jgi:hypothetical protein
MDAPVPAAPPPRRGWGSALQVFCLISPRRSPAARFSEALLSNAVYISGSEAAAQHAAAVLQVPDLPAPPALPHQTVPDHPVATFPYVLSARVGGKAHIHDAAHPEHTRCGWEWARGHGIVPAAASGGALLCLRCCRASACAPVSPRPARATQAAAGSFDVRSAGHLVPPAGGGPCPSQMALRSAGAQLRPKLDWDGGWARIPLPQPHCVEMQVCIQGTKVEAEGVPGGGRDA